MLINRSNLNVLSTGVFTGFLQGMESSRAGVSLLYPQLCAEVSAIGKDTAQIPWLATLPALEKWTGNQKKTKLAINKLEISPDKYSLILALNIPDLENDELRKYTDAAKGFGSDAGDHFEREAANKLAAGLDEKDTLGGASKKFFDTGRKVSDRTGSSTYDNLITGALDATKFETAVKTLEDMTDDSGRKLGLGRRGFTLITGSHWRSMGTRLVKAQREDGGGDNPNYGVASLEVWPYLPSKYWFLMANTAPQGKKPLVKAIFSQLRQRMTDENSTLAIEEDTILWQAYGRHTIAYGDAQLIVGGPGE